MTTFVKSAALAGLVSVGVAFLGCSGEAPSDGSAPVPATSPPATPAEALGELNRIHGRSLERELGRMPASARAEAERMLELGGSDRHALALRFTAAGTPRDVLSPGFRIRPEDVGLGRAANAGDLAAAVVARYAALWGVDARAFAGAERSEQHHASAAGKNVTTIEYRQRHRGIPVVESVLRVHVDDVENQILGITGSFGNVEGVATEPVLDEAMAKERTATSASERAGKPRLVVWSNYRSGPLHAPRLSWEVPVESSDGGLVARAYVDAENGTELARAPVEAHALRRSLWDLRTQPSYGVDTCARWITTTYGPWPAELDAAPACGAHCNSCRTNKRDCALCTCPNVALGDPAGCASQIWRYDETTGCSANGDPVGEGACDAEASMVWQHAKDMWTYWKNTFGRDSWDAAGGYMWAKVNPDPAVSGWFGGLAQPKDVDADGTIDLTQITIHDGSANPFLSGHEFGHTLQFGAYTSDSLSFHAQGVAAMEHNADVNGHRYQGLSLGAGYDCSHPDLTHYSHSWSNPDDGQANKFIGNCQGWLMMQPGAAATHHGVTVSSMGTAAYDQVWYRALDVYFHTSHDYFDWWNDLISATFDLYGFGARYDTAVNARDAAGGFTNFTSPSGSTVVAPNDRYAAVGWQGAANGPCVFYRPNDTSTQIVWRCLSGGSWTLGANFNDTAVDPAASEPSVTYRYESGVTYAYVFWRGATTNRIRYRRFDVATFAIGAASDLGPNHLTGSALAVASVYESAPLDRVVVVYHPLAFPNYFYWTYLGSPSPGVDMGAAFDSDAPPALSPYPYPNRIYFVRPNFATGTAPRHLQYASYTLAGGWTAPTSLTALFSGDAHLHPDVVRSGRGVALAEYNRSAGARRLRASFVTLGDGTGGNPELWMATLRETAPGVLGREDYRAVPLAPTSASSQSAGGLAVGNAGYPLHHFWGQGSSTAPKLAIWSMASD